MIHTKKIYANSIISNDEKDLQDIHLKSKNIAIYQRDIDTLSEEINRTGEQTIECRASGTVEEVLLGLNNYFTHHLSDCPALLEDIHQLLKLFETTTQADSFRLLLATISTNMCRKFHTDINHLRLLCTYMGPGTLWLPNEAVDFKALHKRGSKQEIVKDKQQIQQVRTGDVAFLKGALYPDANPILHRSPSIEEQGEKRLLLRIDLNGFLN